MQVPLAAHRAIQNDTQFVDVWANGERRRVKAPFLPYAFSRERQTGAEHAEEEKVARVSLSTLAEETWWRYAFPTVHGVSALNRREQPVTLPAPNVGRAGIEPIRASGTSLAESHVPYLERVLIDRPDWFRQFPQTAPLKFLYVDIEQLTTGHGFPTPKEPLISIGYAIDEEEPVVIMGDGKTDRDIIEAFLAAVARYDPDIIVGYNVAGYDLPMIVKRLGENGVSTFPLGRGELPGPDPESGASDLFLPGRLVYDVFDSVKRDQTLYGIKDLRLKTVGEWMRFPIVEEDVTDTRDLVGTDRLREYNANDVVLTRNLARIYFKNLVALAEHYGAPLSLIMRSTASFHTNVLQGRVFQRAGIVSDGRNDERYRALYDQAEGQAFVGGIVEIYQRGLFKPVHKVDFSSMYPSIMVSLGCGADNTRFLGTEPLGDFRVDEGTDDVRCYSIPDESRGVNLVVEIRGTSGLAEEVHQLMRERFELKRKAKEAEPEERERLHARQNAIKVILNSIYGLMAAPHARYGSLPVAVATVGVARQLIRLVEAHLGDAKIETDTDGVYSAEPVDADAVNALVADYLTRELGATPMAKVEVEDFAAGYFHQRKSYILLHDDGRLEKHGIAFKGSSLCGVFDKTLDKVSEALLHGDVDVVEVGRSAFDLDQYADEDFIMRVRLGKKLEEYKAGSPIGKQVAELYQQQHGRTPAKGEQLEYVKLKGGYGLPVEGFRRNLDEDYYKGLVETVLDRLGIDWRPTKQVKLFDF